MDDVGAGGGRREDADPPPRDITNNEEHGDDEVTRLPETGTVTDVPLEDQWGFGAFRGSIYVLGPALDDLGSWLRPLVASPEAAACREQRDGSRYHITLLHRTAIAPPSATDSSSTKKSRLVELLGRASAIRDQHKEQAFMPDALRRPIPLYVYETRTPSAATAVAILFIAGEQFLLEEGLPRPNLHMTLGFHGNDERDPSARRFENVKVLQVCQTGSELVGILEWTTTLMRKVTTGSKVHERLSEVVDDLLALIDYVQQTGLDVLQPADGARVSLACSLRAFLSDDFVISLTYSQDALALARKAGGGTPSAPQDLNEVAVRACRRSAAALIAQKKYPEAQACAEEGLVMNPDDPQLRQLWRQCIAYHLKTNAGVTRYRLRAHGIQLPRNFSWVVPWCLGGMSLPTEPEQIDVLSHLGVRLIVTVLDTPCIPQDWLEVIPEERRPKVLFFEVPNLAAPTMEQADAFMQAISKNEEERKGAAVVHCGGGKGRAGTFLALAMMARGMGTWTTVMQKLRILRPGSIESDKQEAFLRDWQKAKAEEKHRLQPEEEGGAAALSPVSPGATDGAESTGTAGNGKTASSTPPPSSSSSSSSTTTTTTTSSSSSSTSRPSRVLLMVGLPCSGKSTVCRVLNLLTKGHAASISQDEAGSKSAFLSRARDLLTSGEKHHPTTPCIVLLDRCHASAEARAEVLSELRISPKQVEVIEVRTGLEECVQRMLRRTGHATLHFSGNKPGEVERARKVIQSFLSRLSFPSATSNSEGFKCIHQGPDKAADLPAFIRTLLLLDRDDVSDEAIHELVEQDLAFHSRPLPGEGQGGGGASPLRKFPRTRHLSSQGSAVGRDDLVLGPEQRAAFLDGRTIITVEEKLDGANLGISLDPSTQELRFQNRSHFVSAETAPQFKPLDRWVEDRRADLYRLLLSTPGSDLVLYGEWLYARHTVAYEGLPDVFVLFDVCDATAGAFYSSDRRDRLVAEHTEEEGSIAVPPRVFRGPLRSLEDVTRLMDGPSMFGGQDGGVKMEGVVLRLEEGGVLRERAKMVSPEFLGAITDTGEGGGQHWSKRQLVRNGVVGRGGGRGGSAEGGEQANNKASAT